MQGIDDLFGILQHFSLQNQWNIVKSWRLRKKVGKELLELNEIWFWSLRNSWFGIRVWFAYYAWYAYDHCVAAENFGGLQFASDLVTVFWAWVLQGLSSVLFLMWPGCKMLQVHLKIWDVYPQFVQSFHNDVAMLHKADVCIHTSKPDMIFISNWRLTIPMAHPH